MKRKVTLSIRARFDLQAIRQWYSQPGSGLVAKAKAQAIIRAIARLSDDPCAYRRVLDTQARVMLVEGHRVMFKILPDTGSNETSGDVLRVMGPGQNG